MKNRRTTGDISSLELISHTDNFFKYLLDFFSFTI